MARARKKTFRIYFLSLIAILGLLSLALAIFDMGQPVPTASAQYSIGLKFHGANINAPGYAWADTIGWIKFRGEAYKCSTTGDPCRTDADCGVGACEVQMPVGYGVGVDPDTGIFSANSWAWSDNVGWIAFSNISVCYNNKSQVCANAGECPGGTCDPLVPPDNYAFAGQCKVNCAAGTSCLACYNPDDRRLYGWAYVLSMGDEGWIKLGPMNNNDQPLKTVDYDPSNGSGDKSRWGEIQGFAWGGDFATKGGLGWVSFNYHNQSADKSNYMVSAQPDKITLWSVKPTEGNFAHSLTMQWSTPSAFNVSWYEIWRREGHCLQGDAVCDTDDNKCASGSCYLSPNPSLVQKLPVDRISFVDDSPPLTLNRTYYYRAMACNIFGCTISAEKSGRTSPIENITNFRAAAICYGAGGNNSFVDLSWSTPAVDSSVAIAHYEMQYCLLDANRNKDNCTWVTADGTCAKPIAPKAGYDQSCRDILDSGNGRYTNRNNYHIYRVRAVGNDGATNQKYCVGGDFAGFECSADTDCTTDTCDTETLICKKGAPKTCPDGTDVECNLGIAGGVCTEFPSTSGWAYGDPLRICVPGGQYQETRPK